MLTGGGDMQVEKIHIGAQVSRCARDILDGLKRYAKSEFIDSSIKMYHKYINLSPEAKRKIDKLMEVNNVKNNG